MELHYTIKIVKLLMSNIKPVAKNSVVSYLQRAMISDSLIAKKLVVCLLRIELLHCLYKI